MFKRFTKSQKYLVILLGVLLLASLAASLVQNSFWSVDVSKVRFETERGELSGYLYVPKDVNEDNPAPAIVTTHGYLNNAEMQEITAIEMSRRGFVVLAFDMYDHGDSTWNVDSVPFTFYVHAVYDAVQYMYDKDIVLKDDVGNGMIGVSGHSMGGYSTESAVVLDEIDYATNGYRKINVALSVGSDFRYVPFPDPISNYGPRSGGMIAAHYDQFFFDTTTDSALGSVRYKDYVKDPEGLLFLGRSDEGIAKAGVFYSVQNGQRVIYTPDETHPQNTWSLETGSNTIEFYEKAFKYQLSQKGLDPLTSYGIKVGKTGQIWWLKELFTFVALISLFALIIPLFNILSKLPVFKNTLKDKHIKVENQLTKVQLGIKIGLIVVSIFLGFFMLTRFMDRSDSLDNLVTILNLLMILSGVSILTLWIVYFIKKKSWKASNIFKFALRITIIGISILLVSFAYRYLLVNRAEIINTDHYYSAPSINTIVYWAMASGGLILLISILANIYFNFNKEDSNPLGLKASPVQVCAGILTGLSLVICLLFLVAVVGWIFKTDFRVYTYAIQIFNKHQFMAGLRYIPLFFIYYFAAAISIYMNTTKIKGWLADLLAAFILAGPILIFLIYQYGTLYSTGVAAYPTFSLSGILTVGLVPTLSMSGIIMNRMSKKTDNIWTSVTFTTIFFTLITLANTTVYIMSKV